MLGKGLFSVVLICGCARYHTHKWYLAIEPLEKALDMNPAAFDVCTLLGACVGRANDPKKAFEYFDMARKMMEPDSVWSSLLDGFRGEFLIRTGKRNQGAEVYYQLWMRDKSQLNLIQQIQNSYFLNNFDAMIDEDKQRYLFITFLYATELLENQGESNKYHQNAAYLRSVLKKFEEEMFMRSLTNYPMIAPDNKKNSLPREKIKELMSRLAEI